MGKIGIFGCVMRMNILYNLKYNEVVNLIF